MSLRLKFILMGVLLLVALGVTAFAATSTLQAFQRFRYQHQLTISGDINTIRPWMTIPHVSYIYHVPESYLYKSLNISETPASRHFTIYTLSLRYNRPVNEFIHNIQRAIQSYRKTHPSGTGQIYIPINRDQVGFNTLKKGEI